MSTDYTGSANFDDSVVLPQEGEINAAESINPAVRTILDAVVYLRQRLISASIITPAGLTIPSSYELITKHGRQYLALRRMLTWEQTHALNLSNPEFGRYWVSQSNIGTADTNTTIANSLYLKNKVGTSTDWYTGTHSAVAWVKDYSPPDLTGLTIIARVRGGMTGNPARAGIIVYNTNNLDQYATLTVGENFGYNLQWTWSGGGPNQVGIDQNTVQNVGVWLMIRMMWGFAFYSYSVANQATPPTSWTFLQKIEVIDTSVPRRAGPILWGSNQPSGAWLYFQDEGDATTPFASNTLLGGAGYDTSWPAVTLLRDYDLGSGTSTTVSVTILRQILSGAINLLPGDAGVWEVSAVQAGTTGASASTYQSVSSFTISGTGRYLSIFARCKSDGTQRGTLALPTTLLFSF